jgi:hypothetical protein
MSCVDPQRLSWTDHALQQMQLRGIARQDIEVVARHHTVAYTGKNGNLNRQATLGDGRPLLAVFAPDGSIWHVVTAYFRKVQS